MNARVLVTAAGSIVAEGIIKSLKLANNNGNIRYSIIAADMSPLVAGLYRCDNGIIVPRQGRRTMLQVSGRHATTTM